MIAKFAEAQMCRGQLVRVMNIVEDGNKIREYRERLAQAVNQFQVSVVTSCIVSVQTHFQVSAHLRSCEILGLMKITIEDCKNRLNEQVSTPSHSLPTAPSDAEPDENPEGQVVQEEELAENLTEKQAAKQEARKKEQKAADETWEQTEVGSGERKTKKKDSFTWFEITVKCFLRVL
jgi:hypothetical protein